MKTELENFSYDIDPITRHVTMHYWEGITFESPQILSILGFKGIRDGTGYHIGRTQLMFIYLDIIHYQIVGDTKAPLLRVIDTNRRVNNGNVCPIEPNHRKVFSNLDYKKLLVNNIQSIGVNLPTETGRLVPFAGRGGKIVLTLKFQKF